MYVPIYHGMVKTSCEVTQDVCGVASEKILNVPQSVCLDLPCKRAGVPHGMQLPIAENRDRRKRYFILSVYSGGLTWPI